MSHLLDELLAQAANGSPLTAAFSSEDVAVLFFASEFLGRRENWLDRGVDPLDEVTDADWDAIEKLVGNVYEALMTPLVGQIVPILLAAVPDNMLLCDGSTHLRVDYPSLYAALDSAFIVDADHFVLPDLRGRTVVGAGAGAGLSPYTVNQVGGEEAHLLDNAELSNHTHTITDPGHLHTKTDPGHSHAQQSSASPAYLAVGGAGRIGYGAVGTNSLTRVVTDSATTGISYDSATTGISIDPEGGSTAHNNIQPYVALNYAVVAY